MGWLHQGTECCHRTVIQMGDGLDRQESYCSELCSKSKGLNFILRAKKNIETNMKVIPDLHFKRSLPCSAEKTKWCEQSWNCQNQLGSHSNGPGDRCQLLGLAQQWPWWWAEVEFWVYFLTALLKYNLRAIQFTHLSCIIQRFLVQAQAWTTITTILDHFHHPQRNPIPFSYHTPTCPLLSALDNYFLFL